MASADSAEILSWIITMPVARWISVSHRCGSALDVRVGARPAAPRVGSAVLSALATAVQARPSRQLRPGRNRSWTGSAPGPRCRWGATATSLTAPSRPAAPCASHWPWRAASPE